MNTGPASPSPIARWLRALAALGLAASLCAQAAQGAPPAGRYRCYQPPAYTVTAWFDLEAGGRYRLNGGEPQAYSFDAGKSLIRWSREEAAQGWRAGRYLPPGSPGPDLDRYTIVIVPRDDARPGQPGWDKFERCYLTTH